MTPAIGETIHLAEEVAVGLDRVFGKHGIRCALRDHRRSRETGTMRAALVIPDVFALKLWNSVLSTPATIDHIMSDHFVVSAGAPRIADYPLALVALDRLLEDPGKEALDTVHRLGGAIALHAVIRVALEHAAIDRFEGKI